MRFVYDDGGHNMYARGARGDCATRAIAISNGMNYRDVLTLIRREACSEEGRTKRSDGMSYTRLMTVRNIMRKLGWRFVDFRKNPLPFTEEEWGDREGTYMLWIPYHFTVVIDGAIHDMCDASNDEREIVKGYWYKNG